MPSAQHLFDQLRDVGSTIHGVIRPDPKSGDQVLFSPHRDLDHVIAIPTDMIAGITKCGELRGLGPDFHSVDLTLRKGASDLAGLRAALERVMRSEFMIQSKPVYCYDHGRWVPCAKA